MQNVAKLYLEFQTSKQCLSFNVTNKTDTLFKLYSFVYLTLIHDIIIILRS